MIAFLIIGSIVNSKLKASLSFIVKYLSIRMTGKEIAEKMLNDNNIHNVKVISVPGKLTDHYNPLDRTINLSSDVYQGRHISAAAVAAHTNVVMQCNMLLHISQLQMRSQMVPIVNISNKMMSTIFILGIFGGFTNRLELDVYT